MNKKDIKIGRIAYVNVDPVYFNFNIEKKIDCSIIAKPPSHLNQMLADKKLDISPVSSAAYAKNYDKWLLLPDLSVSCFGNVMSVLFVSRLKIDELDGRKVIISDESRTAADLIRIFFYSQNIKPIFVNKKIKDPFYKPFYKQDNAAVIIGDAALRFKWSEHFKYVWDLGDLWQHMTDMPFVFALWAVRKSFAEKNKKIVSSVIKEFHMSKRAGLKNIDSIIQISSAKLGISVDKCRKYFNGLNFDLKESQLNGLKTFFDGLYQHRIINKKAALTFFD
jgi:chorismate dehydratase